MKRTCSGIFLAGATFLLFFIYPAFLTAAFAQESEHEVDVVTRETLARERVQEVQEEAEKRYLKEEVRKVTFADILANPDDIRLNYLYAKNQVKEGNLLGAAATLERILLVNPELDKVRLFYAVVLYRLDNWNEARQELQNLLAKENLPDSLRAEVEEYVRRLNRRLRRLKFALRQSVGYQADTNRNAAPSSKKRSFANTLLPVTPTSGRKSDTAFINITNLETIYDLGYQNGHELFGSFTYYLQEQTEVDSLDLQSFQYQFGSNLYNIYGFNFTPKFYASNVFLSRETFLRTQGGSFDLSREIGGRFNAFSSVLIERQSFSGITENPTAPQRNGRYLQLENGFQIALIPSMRLTTSLVYGNKSAEEDINAYERIVWKAAHAWLPGKGQFIINSVNLGRDVYDEPDRTIASRIRRDNSIRYRFTYGAPLETLLIGKILPGFMKDITLTFTYEYYRALSNITNYTYTNNKFQGLLSKRIEF